MTKKRYTDFILKYSKYFSITILLILLISCSSLDNKFNWYSSKKILNSSEQLEEGDILIFSKGKSIKTIWGHSSIINKDHKNVEFLAYGTGYSESPLYTILSRNNKVAVFRLKDITPELKEKLSIEIDKTKNKTYGLTLDKNFDKRLYCSQFVYIVYKNAGHEIGRNIDLDSDGGIWVMPFDIMESKLLKNIKLK